LRDLPIIALTAGALLSERQRATEVGMDDFIIKPFDPAALISSVMHHTVSTVRTVGALVPAVQIHAVPQTADGWVAWADIAGIDIQDARNRFCDDPALFRCSLQRFLGDFPDSAVPSSLSGPADLAEPARRLHKLKGGAGTLGAKAIQHLAAETEAACVAGDGARARERSIELAAHLQALHSSADQVFKRADR
jgi:CheY-like chemotaxis protein